MQKLRLAVTDELFRPKQDAAGGVLALDLFAIAAVAPVEISLAAALLFGKIRLAALGFDQRLVGTDRAGKGVLAQGVGGAAVLQIAPQDAPIVMDKYLRIAVGLQVPAAALFKAAAVALLPQKAGGNARPGILAHKDRRHNTGGAQPLRQRLRLGYLGRKHQFVGGARRAGCPHQIDQHLIRRVADIQIHPSASTSLTGGKWMRPQPGAHSGMLISLGVTSKANSTAGLSRQTALPITPSKTSR